MKKPIAPILFSILLCCYQLSAQQASKIGSDSKTVTKSVNFSKSESKPTLSLKWVQPNTDFSGFSFNTEDNSFPVSVVAAGLGGITQSDFMVKVNGVALTGAKLSTASMRGTTFNMNVPVSAGSNRIEVECRGVVTAAITVNCMPKMPNLYILAIAPETPQKLNYNAKDAQDFINLFKSQESLPIEKRLFGKVNTILLTGKEATAARIAEEVALLPNKFPTKKDVVMVYISTHGYAEGTKLRFQASDFKDVIGDKTSISYRDDILRSLEQIDCKRLIFMDACLSGSFINASAKSDYDNISYARSDFWTLPNEITAISSSGDNELSWEDETWQNGAFTKCIKEGLKNGYADGKGTSGVKDGIITLNELYAYLKSSVPQLVTAKGFKDPRNQLKATQNPVMKNDIGNLSIFVIN